jgi:hypothetical protein
MLIRIKMYAVMICSMVCDELSNDNENCYCNEWWYKYKKMRIILFKSK